MIDHLDKAGDLVAAFADDAQRFGDDEGRQRIERVLDDLRHDRSVAPASFQTGLDVQIQFLDEIADYLTVGGEKDWDFRDFKSAGLDMALQCRDAIS